MFLRDSVVTLVSKAILAVIALGTSILTARILGPEGKGTLSIILLAPALIQTLGGLGLGSAQVFHLGSRRTALGEMVTNSLVLTGGLGFLLVALFFLGFSWWEGLFRGADPQLLFISVWTVPMALGVSWGNNIFLGMYRIVPYNLTKLIQPALFLVLLAAAVALFPGGVSGAVWAHVVGWVLAAVLTFAMVFRAAPLRPWRLRVQVIRSLLTFGVQSHLGGICDFLNRRVDILLLNLFVGPRQVGYYVVAVTIAEGLWYLSRSIASLIFARIARSDPKTAGALTPVVCRSVLGVLVLASAGIYAASFPLVRWVYGEAFVPSVTALWLLLPGVVIYAGRQILSSDLKGRGKPLWVTSAAAAGLSANLLLNLLWIPRWGFHGAALASLCSYTLDSVLILWMYLRVSGVTLSDVFLVKVNDVRLGRYLWWKGASSHAI